MQKFKEVNILEDDALLKKLSIASIILFIMFYLAFLILAIAIRPGLFTNPNMSRFQSIILAILISVGLIIIHEAIHGLFFKLFAPTRKVNFGIVWKKGMAYASSHGSKFTKLQMTTILLMPFVIITTLLTLFYSHSYLSVSGFTLITTFHAVACVGDFYFVFLILKAPRGVLIEDTETGITFWK